MVRLHRTNHYHKHFQWERQQELQRLRRAPEERAKYFQSVEDRRVKATVEQIENEQVWVDEEDTSDGSPFSNLFGIGKTKDTPTTMKVQSARSEEGIEPRKNDFWPF